MRVLQPVEDGRTLWHERLLTLCLVAVFVMGVIDVGSASAQPYGAMAWGENSFGNLGDGAFSGPEECWQQPCSRAPVSVVDLGGVTAVSAGQHFDLALLRNGTVKAWGANGKGELGAGELFNEGFPASAVPVSVSGLTGVTAVAAGDSHSLALLSNGTVVAWGDNEYGELGDGTSSGPENCYHANHTPCSETPILVSGLSKVTAIAAGTDSSYALLEDGTVMAWGDNEWGQLGDGTATGPEKCGESSGLPCSTTPIAVSGLSNVTAISAGTNFALALLSNRTAAGWGENRLAELGDGTNTGPELCREEGCSRTPTAVQELSGVTALAAGRSHSLALLSNGTVKSWGGNNQGELGDGITAGPEECLVHFYCSRKPVAVNELSGVTAISTNAADFSLALLGDGTVKGWGVNEWAQLGDGTNTGPEQCGNSVEYCSKVPVAVGGLKGVAGIAAGYRGHSVAFGPAFPSGIVPKPQPEEQFGQQNAGEPNQNRACAGDPVNCATGNLVESQTDLSLAGRGVPLGLTRTYNAQAAVKQASPGLFGYGWSSSFGDHLAINSEAGTVTVVQANGSAVIFKGTPGVPGELTAPEWAQAKLVLNSDGTYVYTLPSQETFHFDASGRLLSESDRNGNATTMNRNAEGRLESVTDAAGRKMTFAYNAEGTVESVKDPMGHTVKYAYEGGNLSSVTLPGESPPRWQFKYDGSHRLTKMTDGRSATTTNEYDGANRVISQTDPAERTLSFEYGTSAESTPETKITNHATGAVTKEVFTGGDELAAITRGFGTASATTEKRVYDEAGDLMKVTDGNGHGTEYGYDGAGDKTSEVDGDRHETKWTYDATHDVLSTTTPDGETTTIKRDAHGNAEVIDRPAPGSKTQLTKYKYNSLGEQEAVTDPLERTSRYEYDGQGDRTAEVDPEGNKRTWEYNEDSQETATVSPRGNAPGAEAAKYRSKVERDEQGRPLTVTDPLGHKTKHTYDANGNRETQTDANGNKTKYTYDADNEPTKVEAANGTLTETGYDGAGQVTSQTDGNKHATKYIRNVLEQVVEVIDPKERKTLKEYDAAGNLKKLTDAAKRVTTNTYDPANRLTEVAFSDGKTHAIKYEYNGDGARTHVSDASGETSYTYDQLDRMTESKDGHGDVTKYEYDLANEQTKITYPNLKAVTRAYDKDGRLEKITDWLEHATKFAYDPDSELLTTTFPSGTSNVDSYAYNEADQMSEVKMSKGAETLASLAYARDSDGQLKTTTSKGLPGEESLGDTYDPNNRLTKGGAIGYEYDAADNATKVATGTYTYDKADELETGPGVKYAYNEVGERSKLTPSTGAATTYTYDEPGNLIAIEKPKEGKVAGITDTFTYDGNGLRVSQTISGTKTYLAWQMNEALPLILSDGANSYIYGPGGLPIEQISSGGTITYLHHDQQGSTRLLSGSTGTVTGSTTYDAYGNKTGSTGTSTTPLGYDAQYTSQDTGLIYLRQRVFDPATAQFLSADPLEKLTRAPYNYVEDNPVNETDPTGLCSDGSVSGFLDCFNPVSSGNVAYKGAVALNNETGLNLPGLLTRPAVVDLGAAGVCVTPLLDAACPYAIGAAWSVSTSRIVAKGIETNFCNPEQLAGEETVTTLLAGFGALGVYTTGAAEAAGAPGYARAIIRGGPAVLEALLNSPLAATGG